MVLPPADLAGRRVVHSHHPILTAYQAASAEAAGAEVRVLDCALDGVEPALVATLAREFDAVAIHPFEYRRELPIDTTLAVIGALRGQRVAVLNVGLGAQEEGKLFDAGAEVVVHGDSERPLGDWVRGTLAPGDGVRLGGGLGTARGRRESDLSSLPFPAWHLFSPGRYRPSPHRWRRLPTFPVLGARSCPYACDFCPQSIFHSSGTFSPRTAASIAAEVEHLVSRHGARDIEFYDPTWGVQREVALELCDRLSRQSPRVTWSCLVRADLVDDTLLAAMSRAGCHGILVGVESGSEAMLRATGKKVDHAQVRATFALARRHGIDTIASFIVGLPGETPSSAQATLRLACELDATYAQFHLARDHFGRERWLSRGHTEEGWDVGGYSISGRAYVPAGMDRPALARAHRACYAGFYLRPGYIFRRVSALRDPIELRRLGAGLRMLAGAVS